MYNEEEEIPVIGQPRQAYNFMDDDAADALLAQVIKTDIPYTGEMSSITVDKKDTEDSVRLEIMNLLEDAKSRIHDPNWLAKYEKIKKKI